MALPSSGPLSMSQIRTELVNGGIGENIPSTAYGLRALSAAAGFSTPDAISEFLGYSAVSLSYYLYMTAIAGGAMEVYRNKSLVVNVSSNNASGTITATSGDTFNVNVYSYGYVMSNCVARIHYPAYYAIPQAEGTGMGYAAAAYSFTYNGTNATITGNAFTY